MPQILLFDSRSSITPATWPLSYSTAFYYYTTILRFVKVFGWAVNKIVKYMVLSIVEFIQFDEKEDISLRLSQLLWFVSSFGQNLLSLLSLRWCLR